MVKFCRDCETTSWSHLEKWIDDLSDCLIPASFHNLTPKKLDALFDIFLEKAFILTGLARVRTDFKLTDIPRRLACVVAEGRKRGLDKFSIEKVAEKVYRSFIE